MLIVLHSISSVRSLRVSYFSYLIVLVSPLTVFAEHQYLMHSKCKTVKSSAHPKDNHKVEASVSVMWLKARMNVSEQLTSSKLLLFRLN